MTVRSTLWLPAVHAVARSAIAMCALMVAMGSPAALADEAASMTAASQAFEASAATQFTVKPGQSLNDVAIAVTQSHDRAVLARAAKAIFDANQSAFMRGDPSLMKLGAVLNVPPLDASGAVVEATPAAAAPASSPAATSAGAATFTSAAAAAKSASQPVPHPQTDGATASAVQVPAGASAHAWTGAIQPAASGPAQASMSDTSGTAVAGPASSASATAAPTVGAAPTAHAAPASSASAAAAPHERFSSLQQLLALKNRVLMDLQRHGFGSQSPRDASGNGASAASGAAVAAKETAGSAPQVGVPSAPARAPAARLSTADDGFIGIGGYGVRLSRASIPVVAAIAAAIVAALLVLIVGFAVSGRKRRAARIEARLTALTGAAARARAETASQAPPAVADAALRDPVEAEFLGTLARTPTSKRALMGLAGYYAERRNISGFDEIAQRIWHLSSGRGPNWLHIASLGRQLDPDNPLYASSSEGVEAASTASEELDDGLLPDHSAAAQQQTALDAAESWAAEEKSPVANEELPASPAVSDEPPASQAVKDEPASPVAEERTQASPVDEAPVPIEQQAIAQQAVEPPMEHPPVAPEAQPQPNAPEITEGASTESEPAHTPFPADAVNALNDLDMALPPRAEAEGHVEPDDIATREPAPAAVAGLGAARFGALNLAFDLDLPGAERGAPARVATPPQPMFSPEEIAKIARNKLELAAEYIALGDVGGARTLIHEVIESNDPGTRDEALALLATLAPLS